jgi:hypothetical protein
VLELAVVEYISWFNHDRLHGALYDIPPAEFETQHARRCRDLAQRTNIKTDKPTLRQSRSSSPLRCGLGGGCGEEKGR